MNPRVAGGELAERLVCGGAMYLQPAEVLEVGHVVSKDDFLDPALGAFWNLELQMAQAGKQLTPITMIVAATQTTLINEVDEVEITELHGEAWLHASLNNVMAHAGVVAQQGRKMEEIRQLQEDVKERVAQPKRGWWEEYEQ